MPVILKAIYLWVLEKFRKLLGRKEGVELKDRQGRFYIVPIVKSFPGGSEVKASACNVGDQGLIPGLRRFPWRRKWQPTAVFLPGESHGRRTVSYSPRGRKESDMTEQLTLHLRIQEN